MTCSLLPLLGLSSALQTPQLLTDGRKLVPAKPISEGLIVMGMGSKQREGRARGVLMERRGGKLLFRDSPHHPSPRDSSAPAELWWGR
jgi:hypothetical protein